MNKARLIIPVILLAILAVSASAANIATVYTTWDDYFLYAAFEVQDPNLISSNSTYMSSPWLDDDVEIFIETDHAKAANRTPNTYQMAVSASGGSSFQVGQDGQPVPKRIMSWKFAKRINGTLNKAGDRDIGYVIEIGIPWREMGGVPKPGDVMGFNVICRYKGEGEGFMSLSPDVKSEADVQVPAKWTTIRFVDTPTLAVTENGVLLCRKVTKRAPTVDGALGPGEWIKDMSFQLTGPESEVTPVEPGAEPSAQPAQPAAKIPALIEKLAMAKYYYAFQVDLRKADANSGVGIVGGTRLAANTPAASPVPPFPFNQVQWHKDQLSGMIAAGVDVALPVYHPSARDRAEGSSTGLSSMVQAMKEMTAEGKSFPLIGLYLDTSSIGPESSINLKEDAGKDALYTAIRDFFLLVPDEFRATVQKPLDHGGDQAYIVLLSGTAPFSDFDPEFVNYVDKRFAQDFGHGLIWLGHPDFYVKAPNLDGYTTAAGSRGFSDSSLGWIHTATIGPGFDLSKSGGASRPREDGSAYGADWELLLSKSPSWIVIDSWNGLHDGSEIMETVEHRTRYVLATRIQLQRFNSKRQYDVRYLRHNVPKVILPGSICQVNLVLKNTGVSAWNPGIQGVMLAARWYKDGSLFWDSGMRLPLQEPVMVGATLRKMMGIQTVDEVGKPIPEGDYELRIEMIQGRDNWFAAGGTVPLSVPVTIGKPAPGYTLVSSTLPPLMKSGAAYSAKVKLRNDGPQAWKAGAARAGYTWYAMSSEPGTPWKELGRVQADVSIPMDIQPGRIVEVSVPVKASAAGISLAVSTPPDSSTQAPWVYVLRWNMHDGTDELAGLANEAVGVASEDYGLVFTADDTPRTMKAGREYTVSLSLRNAGVSTWSKAAFRAGAHWYGSDGSEILWDGSAARLPSDIAPGAEVRLKAKVSAPVAPGRYYLVWDAADGDKWISTTAIARGGSTVVVPVEVR